MPVPYAKLENPQTLNLYSYVGNNPLSRTDPTGHYLCEGNKTNCGIVRTALALTKQAYDKLPADSKERAQLGKVLSAYGKEGVDNHVNVTFGGLKGYAQSVTSTANGTTTVKFDLKEMATDMAAQKANVAVETTATVAHEGAIAFDQRQPGVDQSSRSFIHAEESHAGLAEAGIYRGFNLESPNGYWSPAWAPADAGANRDQAIQNNADRTTSIVCNA